MTKTAEPLTLPENRKVFYIDVNNLTPQEAKLVIETLNLDTPKNRQQMNELASLAVGQLERIGAIIDRAFPGLKTDPRSTHDVHRNWSAGPESIPCYCAATEDHHIGQEKPVA